VTTTLPLQIELLFHDYNIVGAFTASLVLAGVALLTIVLKLILERFGGNEMSETGRLH
jgi:sulfate transport system permease protein